MLSIQALVRSVCAVLLVVGVATAHAEDHWSASELRAMQSLSLYNLEDLPADPSNHVADDARAAQLGQRLFFDTRLSGNGEVACASCHLPDRQFQDDRPLGKGMGTTNRRTMPVAGTAYSHFLFWDGRKDSQWAQALGPLESAVEHGGSRAQYAHVIADHYRTDYETLFGTLPDLQAVPRSAGPVADAVAAGNWQRLTPAAQDAVTQVFVNIGKAIAAYERRIQFQPSRFDAYVAALPTGNNSTRNLLTADEKAGLRLFIGKANCTQCHNGPLFTNEEFHNTGIPVAAALPQDRGRGTGATGVLADEFNCRSRWSDLKPERCLELKYMITGSPELERAYKVPSLRNVTERAPYMHAGQLATLADVVNHYNKAPAAPAGHTEIKPLKLDAKEIAQLIAFLHTLDGGTTAPASPAKQTLSQTSAQE